MCSQKKGLEGRARASRESDISFALACAADFDFPQGHIHTRVTRAPEMCLPGTTFHSFFTRVQKNFMKRRRVGGGGDSDDSDDVGDDGDVRVRNAEGEEVVWSRSAAGGAVSKGSQVTVHATAIVEESGYQFWSTKDAGQQLGS